jgi:hypothetical protein
LHGFTSSGISRMMAAMSFSPSVSSTHAGVSSESAFSAVFLARWSRCYETVSAEIYE